MRLSPWLLPAALCAALLPNIAAAAHVNEADLSRPRGPLLSPDAAWSLQHPTPTDEAAESLLESIVAASPPEVAESLRGRLEDPILLPGGLKAAQAAAARLRQAAEPAALLPQSRAEPLTDEQAATFALLGLSILIFAGSGVAFVARAPGGVGGLSRG